jgi:hypothetical protein
VKQHSYVALLLALIAALAHLTPAYADEARRLQWEELVPKLAPLVNPLDSLPPDQISAIRAITYYHEFPPGPMDADLAPEREEARATADAARKRLARYKIDADALYSRYSDWKTEVKRRGSVVASELDGKSVKIAGYLLPLDFNEAGVKEFLLVPYVGACIHVPPPPPNQVVYVKSETPRKLDGLYDAVLVTGKLATGAVSKSLSLVDGANKVDAGYTLLANSIDPFHD